MLLFATVEFRKGRVIDIGSGIVQSFGAFLFPMPNHSSWELSQRSHWCPSSSKLVSQDPNTNDRSLRLVNALCWSIAVHCFLPLEDERGIDGVIILPSDGKKKVTIGCRMASTKEKRTEHEDKSGQDEAFEKAAAGLAVQGQTQDS